VTVAADGQPTKLVFQRWSNANPEQEYHLQPFGGYLSSFQDFQGYRLPNNVEAGNHFGTEAYFPFYRVNVTEISFPQEIHQGASTVPLIFLKRQAARRANVI